MTSRPPKCIYCGSTENQFNRDHVMPEAFGTFEPDSFVLHEAVCEPCNSLFGKTIEQSLSRDSLEAVLRLRHGVKPAREAADLPYKRVELKVGQPGPWLGVTVVLEADKEGLAIEPVLVPQVAFRWRGATEWNFFLERELEDATRIARYRGAQKDTLEIRIMAPSESAYWRLIEKLEKLNIRFIQQGKLEQPISANGDIRVDIASQLDATILRAIAKIAFNYAAFHHGADFVLASDFDDVRRYIRYGTEPHWHPVVQPSWKPILFDDEGRHRQTNGHLITLDWNRIQTGLLAQVSLFNAITYRVTLCRHYSGIWHMGLRIGHLFDIEDRSISPLGVASLVQARV